MFTNRSLRKIFMLVVGIVSIGLFQFASADWHPDPERQNLTITLKSNPMANPEAACLAVTFANSFKDPANVTLFVTLDGVTLADKSIVSSPRFKCELSDGSIISLSDHLDNFIDNNPDNLVVCPICWRSRYGEEIPDYGILPNSDDDNAMAIGSLIMSADKILDF